MSANEAERPAPTRPGAPFRGRRGLSHDELRAAVLAAALATAGTVLTQGGPLPSSIEVLEGVAQGAAGVPWWRLRAGALGWLQELPLGSLASRMALVTALAQGVFAAVVSVRTARLLRVHAAEVAPQLAPFCAVLAALLAVSTRAAVEVAAAPSSAAWPALLLLATLLARGSVAAFGCGLLCAVDAPFGVLAALLVAARDPGALWAARTDRVGQLAFGAGLLPGIALLVPGRSLYTVSLRAELLPAPPSWLELGGQLGLPLLACAALGALPLARNPARRRALRERALLGTLALLLACGSGYTSEAAVLVLGALAAELTALWLWLGGAWLLARRVPLARAVLTLLLAVLCAWPLARLDDERVHASQRALGESAVELSWRSSVPDDALLLLQDGLTERALLAQQALGAVSPRLSLYPLREVESERGQMAIALDPALLPVARETLLTGSPSELSLVNLASQRPVLLEADAASPRAVLKHLLPEGPWLRFDPEPRGASDRLLALRGQERLHAFAQAEVAQAPAPLRERLWATVERSAWALSVLRERDSSALAVELLRGYAPDSAVLRALLEANLSAAKNEKIEAIELPH